MKPSCSSHFWHYVIDLAYIIFNSILLHLIEYQSKHIVASNAVLTSSGSDCHKRVGPMLLRIDHNCRCSIIYAKLSFNIPNLPAAIILEIEKEELISCKNNQCLGQFSLLNFEAIIFFFFWCIMHNRLQFFLFITLLSCFNIHIFDSLCNSFNFFRFFFWFFFFWFRFCNKSSHDHIIVLLYSVSLHFFEFLYY